VFFWAVARWWVGRFVCLFVCVLACLLGEGMDGIIEKGGNLK